jgi:hypothetical protein
MLLLLLLIFTLAMVLMLGADRWHELSQCYTMLVGDMQVMFVLLFNANVYLASLIRLGIYSM